MTQKSEIAKMLQAAISMPDYDSAKIESMLEMPPDKKMGDLAFPCFKLAPVFKKAPVAIAEELKSKVVVPKSVDRVELAGGYLNFFLKAEQMAESILGEILKKGEKFGKASSKGTGVIMEFCDANTHKAFHIGHVRNISLAESICRILEFNGHKVYRVNYQGDVGPHVSKCLWGYLNFFKGKEPKDKTEKGIWLGTVYADASQKVEGNEELEQKMRDLTKQLFDGDKKLKAIWQKTRKWSLDYFAEIYKNFGVKFDRFYFESEMEKRAQQIAKELTAKGIAKESEGAIIMDLEEFGLGKFVILKSDEMPLYSSKDLALAEKKWKEFKFGKSIIVTGEEQKLYFQQLFKTLELMNSPMAKISIHIAYGLVNLESGKMKSRLGEVITWHRLYGKMCEKTLQEVKKRHKDWPKKKAEQTAKKIALAAIKFGMLNRANEKLAVFDWEKALQLEGETGPYLMYSYARAKSILRKAKKITLAKGDFSVLKEEKEKELVALLGQFETVVQDCARQYAALTLSQYLLKLSECFNGFYHELPVLKAEPKLQKARLGLVMAAATVLQLGMKLLGIDSLEEM